MMGPELGLLVLGRYPADEFKALVEDAEALGYDMLWYADERFFRDCWASLAFAAAHSKRIRLGVCVTDPFVRHPALTAAAIGTVDELSGGRAVLGLGVGISGFAEMGVHRDRPLTAMRESVGLIRALLRGERTTLEGDVISFQDGQLDFPTRSDLPIMIATNGPKMLQLAGELVDSVMVQNMASTQMVNAVQEQIAVGAARAGRSPEEVSLIARLDVCISDDDPALARDRVRQGITRHLASHHPRYASFKLAGIDVPQDLSDVVAKVGYTHGSTKEIADRIPDEWVDLLCLAGTTESVVERISDLLDAGVKGITVMPLAVDGGDPRDMMAHIAEVVMPRVRELRERALA